MKKILSILAAVVLVVLLSLFNNPGEQTETPALTQPAPLQTEAAATAAPAETELAVPEETETFLPEETENTLPEEALPDINGSYTTKEDVALYLHLYGELPDNFITKSEARKLGWEGGGLDDYAYGKCIGGDRFGNNEKLLPEDRQYFECDINTLHKTKRGAERLVFSEDGLIYYTADHYESFELLYGEP